MSRWDDLKQRAEAMGADGFARKPAVSPDLEKQWEALLGLYFLSTAVSGDCPQKSTATSGHPGIAGNIFHSQFSGYDTDEKAYHCTDRDIEHRGPS